MVPSQPIQIGMNGRFFANNWRPARTEIAFAHEHGFTCLQFRGTHDGLSENGLGATLSEVAGKLRAASVVATMEIAIGVDSAGRTHTGACPMDVLEANLLAIKALPCPFVHWHLVPRDSAKPEANRKLEESLRPEFAKASALAQKHGFVFGFEHNEPELDLFGTPDSCTSLLENVPNLKFVWDLNHTTPEHLAGFRALTQRTSLIHVSDTPLPEVNHHLPLGLGSIDFTSRCRDLFQGGFSGPAILEIGGLPKSGGFGRDTDDALVHSQHQLRQAFDSAMKGD